MSTALNRDDIMEAYHILEQSEAERRETGRKKSLSLLY